LIGIAMAFSVEAGAPEDTRDPLSAALDWEDATVVWSTLARSAMERSARRDALLERAMAQETLPVIVLLKDGTVAPGPAPADVRSRWASQRQQALRALGLPLGRDRAGLQVKTFEQRGGFAMQADAIDILDLLADPEVLDVVEDVAYPPALLQSTPLIGASASSDFAGYSGLGQVIAILDTGVDKSHPLLSGKVVSEASYSTNRTSSSGIRSLCPSRVTSSTATGSGVPCTWESGCSHGTHVAGIAAGNNTSYRGVAKDAKLIAIQVFSGFPSSYSACGGSPCVLAYTSDIIKGLERVYALRSSYAIAAANLSLGGGRYTSACDADATKASIDKLRTVNIATVIASGNSGYTDAVGSPACVSTAVSVGASCDASGSNCSAVDAVASYSNIASFVSLIAPGSLITSSVTGTGYATWHGTSMATPHVAGAWAVLKQVRSTASVAEILDVLRATGKSVYDAGSSTPLPRIQLASAVTQLTSGDVIEPPPEEPPPVAELSTPTLNAATNVTRSSFRISWSSVTGATAYQLELATNSGFSPTFGSWSGITTTAASFSGLARNTTYYVRVKAYNADTQSPYSATRSVRTSRW
jgi:subtilisin family serine protease